MSIGAGALDRGLRRAHVRTRNAAQQQTREDGQVRGVLEGSGYGQHDRRQDRHPAVFVGALQRGELDEIDEEDQSHPQDRAQHMDPAQEEGDETDRIDIAEGQRLGRKTCEVKRHRTGQEARGCDEAQLRLEMARAEIAFQPARPFPGDGDEDALEYALAAEMPEERRPVVAFGEIVLQHEIKCRTADERDEAHDQRRVDAVPDGKAVFGRAVAEQRVKTAHFQSFPA